MAFNVEDLPSPENRTAAHWVIFYLRLEGAVDASRSVTVNGRTYTKHSIDEIQTARKHWEAVRDREAVTAGERFAPIYLG